MPGLLEEEAWKTVEMVLVPANLITSCALGPLYKGEYKCLRCLYLLSNGVADREVLTKIAAVRNDNVATILAVSFSPSEKETCLIFSWPCDILWSKINDNSLSWLSRLRIAAALARVLHLLRHVIRGEVASTAIGVDATGCPMLLGVGLELALPLTVSSSSSSGYTSPEREGGGGLQIFDEPCAVFNMGVLLLELFSGAPARSISGGGEEEEELLHRTVHRIFSEDYACSLDAVALIEDARISEESEPALAQKVLAMALACTAEAPADRPVLLEVWQFLDNLHRDQRDLARCDTLLNREADTCGGCGNITADGTRCERGHYMCRACLDAVVLSWSERRHIVTRNRGVIFCPKRFEFGGSYRDNPVPLCDATPWMIEDLRGIISADTYDKYMSRVHGCEQAELTVSVARQDSAALLPCQRMESLMCSSGSLDDGDVVADMDDVVSGSAQDKKDCPVVVDSSRQSDVKGSRLSSRHFARYSPVTEPQILMKLFGATDGPRWRRHTNWGRSRSYWGAKLTLGDWHHVRTSGGAVIELNLRGNRLSGMLPYELGQLRNLRVLNLSRNSLRGVIPESISGLESLSSLNLSENCLAGNIPPEVFLLVSLISLDLSFNKLSGPLSPSVSNLTNLRVLAINNNMLSGQVPSVVSLRHLQLLALHMNRFTGPMVTTLKSNPKLRLTY